jgi:hypothetical protein
MEMLIIAVALFLVYVLLEKFNPTVESFVDLSNNKAQDLLEEQATKQVAKRSKRVSKLEDLDVVISHKEFMKLVNGKVKVDPTEGA